MEDYYEALKQENISGDRMKVDLRKIEIQDIRTCQMPEQRE